MRVSVVNLGALKNADREVGDFTIIAGEKYKFPCKDGTNIIITSKDRIDIKI